MRDPGKFGNILRQTLGESLKTLIACVSEHTHIGTRLIASDVLGSLLCYKGVSLDQDKDGEFKVIFNETAWMLDNKTEGANKAEKSTEGGELGVIKLQKLLKLLWSPKGETSVEQALAECNMNTSDLSFDLKGQEQVAASTSVAVVLIYPLMLYHENIGKYVLDELASQERLSSFIKSTNPGAILKFLRNLWNTVDKHPSLRENDNLKLNTTIPGTVDSGSFVRFAHKSRNHRYKTSNLPSKLFAIFNDQKSAPARFWAVRLLRALYHNYPQGPEHLQLHKVVPNLKDLFKCLLKVITSEKGEDAAVQFSAFISLSNWLQENDTGNDVISAEDIELLRNTVTSHVAGPSHDEAMKKCLGVNISWNEPTIYPAVMAMYLLALLAHMKNPPDTIMKKETIQKINRVLRDDEQKPAVRKFAAWFIECMATRHSDKPHPDATGNDVLSLIMNEGIVDSLIALCRKFQQNNEREQQYVETLSALEEKGIQRIL
ncbi:hypothetical protein VKT23_014363 [Stygiomarasmius scandens]|uniref:Uncharacterized protein n=1 Tax=Marasmiellus scandens TaxID=2682957 RepID=A0ABR1J380_9AGAR